MVAKYYRKFANVTDIEKDNDLKIINKKQLVMLMHNNICIGAVIYDTAKKKVANHFRYKIKNTVDIHPKLNCEKSHAVIEKLIGHGIRANSKKAAITGKYVYNNEKNLDPEKQRIYVKNEDSFRK